MNTELKVRVAPQYVSTGTILDSKGNYVAGTKTKQDAEKFVTAVTLYDNLINKFAND